MQHKMEPAVTITILSDADAAGFVKNPDRKAVLDELGRRSALAQHLHHPITSAELFTKHATPQRQRLYLAASDDVVVGFIKSGYRHLYYVNRQGKYFEMDPLCVLDFYVHEDHQRRGIGLQLFRALLEEEAIRPERLAYDRPSTKFLAFLRKHMNLNDFFPQPNNFVVFDAYFRQ